MYISHSRSRQLQNTVAPNELFDSLAEHKKTLLNSASLSALTTQNVARTGNHATASSVLTASQLYLQRQQRPDPTSGATDYHEEHYSSGFGQLAASNPCSVPVSRGVKFPFKKPNQPAPIASATALYHFGAGAADDDVRSSSSLSSGSSTPETPSTRSNAALDGRTPLWKSMKIPKKVPAHAISTLSSKNEIANKLDASTTFSSFGSSQHGARNGYNTIQHRHRNLSSTPSPKSCPLLSNLKRDVQTDAYSRHSPSNLSTATTNHFYTKHHSQYPPITKLSSKSSSTGSKNSAKADKEYNGYFQSQHQQQQQQYEHQEQFKAPSPLGTSSTLSASIRASQSSKYEQSQRASKVSTKSHERSDSACSTRSTSKEVRKEKASHKESSKSKQNIDISANSGKKEKDKKSKGDSKRDRSSSARSSSAKEKKRKRKKQQQSSSSSSSDSSCVESSDSDDSDEYDKYSKNAAGKTGPSSKRQRLNSASSTSSLPTSTMVHAHPARSAEGGERSKHKIFAETVGGHLFPGLINNRIPKIKRDTSQSPLPLPSPQFSDANSEKKESTKKNSKLCKDVRNNSGGTEMSHLLSTKIKYQDEKTVTTIEIKEFNKKKTWDNSNECKVLKKEKESSKSSTCKVPNSSSKSSATRNRERSSSLDLDDNIDKSSRKTKSSKHSDNNNLSSSSNNNSNIINNNNNNNNNSTNNNNNNNKYQAQDDEHNRKTKSDRGNRNSSVDASSKSKSKKQRELLPSSILLDKKSSKFGTDSSQTANSYVDLTNKLAQNVAFTAEHHAAHYRKNQRQLSDDDDKMSVSSAGTSNSSRSSSSMSSASSTFVAQALSNKRNKSKSKSENGRKSLKEHKTKHDSDSSKRKHSSSKKSKKYENPISDSESENEHSESKFVAKRATSDSDDDSVVNYKHIKRPESGNRNSINGTATKPLNAGFTGLSDSDSETSDINTVIKSPPIAIHSKSSKKSKKSSKNKHAHKSDMSQSDESDGDEESITIARVQSSSLSSSVMVAHQHKQDLNISSMAGIKSQQLALPGSIRSPVDRAALSSGYGTDRLSVSPAQSAFNNSSPQIKQAYSLNYSELHVRLSRINDSKKLQKVMDLIDERNFECLQIVDNRIEFDLKKLDHATLAEIRRLVC